MTPTEPVTPLRVVDRPLHPSELAAAAALLGSQASPTALVGLALPAGTLPDAELVVADSVVVWRGTALRAEALRDPEAVAAWAAAAWQPDDQAAVPEGPLWRWVRPVHSGAGVVVWGPAALWGGADVRCGLDVGHGVVFDTLARWWAGEEIAPPALLSGPDGALVFVDGDDSLWKLGVPGTAGSPEHPDDAAVATLVEAAAADVDARSWTITRPTRRSRRWVAHLELVGWRATFDVVAGAGSLQVGRRPTLGAAPDDLAVPSGWEAVGAAGATVCARSHSGLWAVLEPTR